jgi:gas vesicle protein
MNDTDQDKTDMRSFAPIIGFALGALVGGGLALLLAPASGQRTRGRLGKAARRLRREARHTFDEARETVSEAANGLGVNVRSAVDAGREAFRHDREPREARPVSRMTETLNP